MKNKVFLIYDFADERLFNNKVFNFDVATKISHTYGPICYLYKELKKENIEFITPDIYLKNKVKYRDYRVYILSHLQSQFTDKLISNGAIPLILTCQESPFIATKFFINLKNISKKYKHSFVFSGMRSQLHINTKYHQMFFPSYFNVEDFSSLPFSTKKTLVMVSGYKKNNKSIGKSLIIKMLYGLDSRIIYNKRQEIINYFFNKNNFDLFGWGWDKCMEDDLYHKACMVYRGRVENKHSAIKNYKFVFSFENSIFKGYITEKIFDTMIAGCVPIYLGAPDVESFIPKNCFIDYRDFDSVDNLNRYISEMSKEKYALYISHIHKYLQSDLYKKFSQESFASDIIKIIKEEAYV